MNDFKFIDSDRNTTMFCDTKYTNKIWGANECAKKHMNGEGHVKSNRRWYVPHLGMCLHNFKSMTNTITLSEATDKSKVIMDTKK